MLHRSTFQAKHFQTGHISIETITCSHVIDMTVPKIMAGFKGPSPVQIQLLDGEECNNILKNENKNTQPQRFIGDVCIWYVYVLNHMYELSSPGAASYADGQRQTVV